MIPWRSMEKWERKIMKLHVHWEFDARDADQLIKALSQLDEQSGIMKSESRRRESGIQQFKFQSLINIVKNRRERRREEWEKYAGGCESEIVNFSNFNFHQFCFHAQSFIFIMVNRRGSISETRTRREMWEKMSYKSITIKIWLMNDLIGLPRIFQTFCFEYSSLIKLSTPWRKRCDSEPADEIVNDSVIFPHSRNSWVLLLFSLLVSTVLVYLDTSMSAQNINTFKKPSFSQHNCSNCLSTSIIHDSPGEKKTSWIILISVRSLSNRRLSKYFASVLLDAVGWAQNKPGNNAWR